MGEEGSGNEETGVEKEMHTQRKIEKENRAPDFDLPLVTSFFSPPLLLHAIIGLLMNWNRRLGLSLSEGFDDNEGHGRGGDGEETVCMRCLRLRDERHQMTC